MHYTPENQPSPEDLDKLADFFHHMAGVAEGDDWMDLYLDAAGVLKDVVAAWRGEITP